MHKCSGSLPIVKNKNNRIVIIDDISAVKLKRTDTTLDLSQKAKRAEEKKGKQQRWGASEFIYPRGHVMVIWSLALTKTDGKWSRGYGRFQGHELKGAEEGRTAREHSRVSLIYRTSYSILSHRSSVQHNDRFSQFFCVYLTTVLLVPNGWGSPPPRSQSDSRHPVSQGACHPYDRVYRLNEYSANEFLL